MDKKPGKTREEIAEAQAEIEKLRAEVLALCNKVPPSVVAGSYQTAVGWKERAMTAYQLATSKAPTADKLRNALAMMQRAAT